MAQIVIMPGGFHPFHAGHMALYNSARQAFPNAEVYIAATNDQSERPFPFSVKEKLAKVAGVEPGHFVQVKSPFQAKEITQNYNPEQDVLIFVRSEKDRTENPKPGGTKKDGSPAYFQPYTGENMQPFGKHAYMAYLPTVKFGPGITSATEIRKAWPTLNDKRKTAMVMSLYPASQKNPKLAANIVGMLDQIMGGQLEEGWKEKVGAAALAGAVATGAGANTPKVPLDKAIQNATAMYNINKAVKKHKEKEAEKRKSTDKQVKEQGVLEGLEDTQKKIEDTINKLEDRLKHAKTPEQWDRIKDRIERLQVALNRSRQGVTEDKESDPITTAVLHFYKPVINDIHKEKLPDYVDQARELLHKTNDPKVRSKLIDIFKKGKENPYIQGGIVTTVGAVLAGGVLTTAQRMGLSPAQTNLALQAILNTVIPTVVSRINGKNWSDTIKYTLASAGIGTGIAGAGLLEDKNLSVEELAQVSDKALDDAYHYGRSTPGANFGWLANMQSAKAAKRLIDAGETDIEKISDAIHKGWNVTAAADYKGQLQLDTPTPDDKKLKRAKLAMQSYSQLPEEEKEKDRVVARALLSAIKGGELEEGSEEALQYATQAHAGQTRSGGDPYITHPMRVADHIRQYKQSHNLDALISAAYLHDTIEDTDTTHEALHDLFGGLVASLVKELTSDPEEIKRVGKAQYLAHKMAAMSSYALVIKLADRLDNVKDITTARTPQWRAKYAAETNQILNYIEKTRALSGTHQKLIGLIRAKLSELDNPQPEVDEGFGLPMPGTYEQEHGPANNNGSQHLVAMTSESSLSKNTDYLEEK